MVVVVDMEGEGKGGIMEQVEEVVVIGGGMEVFTLGMRMIALAPKTEILYYVAFVDRGDVRRIVSLRRANRREVKHYVENDETL